MNKKILLVEDDAFVRDLYQTVLTRAGYDIDLANDGEEALSMADYKVYDLVLLDIMLPKLTGMEVLKQLRTDTSRAKNTPVYLLTNLGEENIIKEAYKLGANGYLLKAKYLPKQLVEEVDKFFVKPPSAEESLEGSQESIANDALISEQGAGEVAPEPVGVASNALEEAGATEPRPQETTVEEVTLPPQESPPENPVVSPQPGAPA